MWLIETIEGKKGVLKQKFRLTFLSGKDVKGRSGGTKTWRQKRLSLRAILKRMNQGAKKKRHEIEKTQQTLGHQSAGKKDGHVRKRWANSAAPAVDRRFRQR